MKKALTLIFTLILLSGLGPINNRAGVVVNKEKIIADNLRVGIMQQRILELDSLLKQLHEYENRK